MKKSFTVLVLFFILFFNATNCVYAYKYKVYDPSSNKTYYANMMTLGTSTPNIYNLGFFGGGLSTFATIHPKTNKNNSGLIGGDAIGPSGNVLKWRELEPNNYYKEMNAIVKERKKEGMKISLNYISLPYILSVLFLK